MNSPSQRIFSVQFDFPYKYISDTVIGLEGFELYLEEHIGDPLCGLKWPAIDGFGDMWLVE